MSLHLQAPLPYLTYVPACLLPPPQMSAQDSFEVAFNAACALIEAGSLEEGERQLQLAHRIGGAGAADQFCAVLRSHLFGSCPVSHATVQHPHCAPSPIIALAACFSPHGPLFSCPTSEGAAL